MRTEARRGHLSMPGFGTTARVVAAAIALAILMYGAPGIAHAQTDSGSIGVRLIDVPASSASDPRARQYVVDHLEPGTTIERRFEVSNTTAEPMTLEVYAAGAGIVDGSFLGETGRTANELSSWTTITEPTVEIAAQSTTVNTVTVAVPTDAAPGEQYGAIWVEARGDDGGNVEIVNRVGIRMYVSVGGSNPPSSSFTVDTLTAERDADGRATVSALVHNTGGRAIDATASITLTKVGTAVAAGPYLSSENVALAPGESAPVQVAVTDDIDAGPWDVAATVTSGLVEVQAQAQLTFPDAGVADAVVPAIGHDSTVFWIAGGGMVLLVLVGILFGLTLRSRTRSRR